MIEVALLAIGLVLIVEGLVYALAPSLIEDLLDRLRTLSFLTGCAPCRWKPGG